MVTNVKMQVTPDLSKRVQEIIGAVCSTTTPFLVICKDGVLMCLDKEDEQYYRAHPATPISAYDFIASQGQQKWLPRFGELAEFSDDCVNWVSARFLNYDNQAHMLDNCPFIVEHKQISFKYCRPRKPTTPTKTLTIDGKNIEISAESFEALKQQLLK